MTKKRHQSKQTKAKSSRSWAKSLFWFLFKLGLVATVVAAVGLVYLDAQVREKFEGKRWSLPAKVYARPLELYPGQRLDSAALQLELKALGYSIGNQVNRPGTARVSANRADIYTRGFDFPEGAERSKRVTLSFQQGQIARLMDANNRSMTLARLEPVLIGGIYPGDNEDRELVRIQDVPNLLPQALVAVEDRAFYDHFGISLKGIARAMWVNLRAGRFVQGGSTLTQQLIKNFYLTSERTLSRKLLELPMAVLLDLHYEKDEILEAYLNEVYLGQDGARAIHGFGQGSLFYFGRPAAELELHHIALLAGLVKGPSYYDPRRHPERALKRRDLVLKLLLDQAMISSNQYQRAIQQPLDVIKRGTRLKGAYPAYLDVVKRQLRQEYREEDLNSEGIRIFTALDPLVQQNAASALSERIALLEKQYGKKAQPLQGATVVTDPQTGELLAVIGGRNARFAGFNRALDARRPIGSLVKPATFLAALEKGYTLTTLIEDSAFQMQQPDGSVWSPENFDGKEKGMVPLYEAISRSYNLSSARLGLDIGVDSVIDMLKRLGVDSEIKPYPSLLLGALNLAPIEVAQVYQTLAANGFRMPLRAIRRVTDAYGQELSRYPFKLNQVVDPKQVHLIHYAMQSVAREGTARSLYRTLPANLNVAGKTGTSDQQRDSWFAGFTGSRLAVVWVGRDDNATLPFTGSGGALKVWTDLMKREQPEPYLALKPREVEYVWVDASQNVQTDQQCEGARSVPYIQGTEPVQRVSCGGKRKPGEAIKSPLDWFKGWFN
ncbi:MAG: penicillin-binding protein 1B [Marinobacterium sp.]